MANLKSRQQQLRHEVILETAQQLLEEQGYASFNMDDLASRVGISKATLYQHFPSKDELVTQVVLLGMQQGEKTLQAMSPDLSPREKLEQVLHYSIQKRIHMALIRVGLPRELYHDPRIRERHDMAIGRLTTLIEAGKANGSFRKELSTPIIVHMFFGFFSPTYEDLMREGVISAEELSENLISIFLEGICSPTTS